MKNIIKVLIIALPFLFTACEYDNYDEPNATISGKMVYDGQAIYVKNNQVTFRLYEPGWELSASTYMDVQVAQDGTFSASVYAGKTYKLIRQDNIGPWVNPVSSDTVFVVNCAKNQTVDIPVVPYFMLDNVSVTCSNKVVSGTCSVKEIVAGKNIEFVGLYAGRNIIVDNSYNFGGTGNVTTTAVAGDQITLSLDLSGLSVNSTSGSLPSTGIIYARMGLKIDGIDAMIYTEPFKLSI
jgi:hypothetical protein